MLMGLGNLPSEVQGKPSLGEEMPHLWTLRKLTERVQGEALLQSGLENSRGKLGSASVPHQQHSAAKPPVHGKLLPAAGHWALQINCTHCRSLTRKIHWNQGDRPLSPSASLQCPLLTKFNFVPAGKEFSSNSAERAMKGGFGAERQWIDNWHGDGVYDSNELLYQATLFVILGSALFWFAFSPIPYSPEMISNSILWVISK